MNYKNIFYETAAFASIPQVPNLKIPRHFFENLNVEYAFPQKKEFSLLGYNSSKDNVGAVPFSDLNPPFSIIFPSLWAGTQHGLTLFLLLLPRICVKLIWVVSIYALLHI